MVYYFYHCICLCIVCPGDFFFILNSRLANCLGKKGSFWLSLCSILIVVPLLLSAPFFHFGFLNGNK